MRVESLDAAIGVGLMRDPEIEAAVAQRRKLAGSGLFEGSRRASVPARLHVGGVETRDRFRRAGVFITDRA